MEASELHAKPYRELQQLCKELGLGGKGKKTELVERLLAASHGERRPSLLLLELCRSSDALTPPLTPPH
jgi:hypothetical protein